MKTTNTTTGAECRTYWGTHGCDFERGHEGDHACHHADWDDDPGYWVTPSEQYPGLDVNFYGEDAPQ